MSRMLRGIKHFLVIFALSLSIAAYADSELKNIFATTASVTIARHEIIYDSIGQGENILLLHGVFGSKNQWTEFAGILAKNGYHVIIPDLPGYGQSVGFPEKDYAIKKQVKLLNQFTKKLKLDKFAIAGNSMGGLIAAEYAKKYPKQITSLAFIGAPLGVDSPQKSKAEEMLSNGKNPFIPLTEQEFHEEMQLLFTTPPKFSDAQIQERITRYQEEREKDLRIWLLLEKYNNVFNTPFKVSAPTLIIWGDNDNIFNISGAEILKNNIENSELIIVKDGSHLLFMEDPKYTAEKYLSFLKNSEKESNSQLILKK